MNEAPRNIGQPEPGFFKMRLVRGGVYVGAKIEYGPGLDPESGEPLDRSYQWYGEINGKAVSSPSPDPAEAEVFDIWIHGKPITENEYKYLIDDREWASNHAQQSPEAQPRQKINPRNQPPALPPR